MKVNFGAKVLSKTAMIIAVPWIGVLTILKGLGYLNGITVKDIIYTGVAFVAIWAPTYLSIILDKVKDIKSVLSNPIIKTDYNVANNDHSEMPAIN